MKKFIHCPVAAKCLNAYFDHDSLIVFHSKSGHVYGFEREAAALFLQVDELLSKSYTTQEIVKQFANVPSKIIHQYAKLASCENINDKEFYEPPLDVGTYLWNDEERVFYGTDELTFAFVFNNVELKGKIESAISHLERKRPGKKIINVDLLPVEDKWQVTFNEKKIAQPVATDSLPLVLQENMIIAYYQKEPYLMAMHAGAVERNGKAIVLPGSSGSGKSTLTATLVAKGFNLFSDEIALLGYDGNLKPIPFSMNIKEGSWSVLSQYYKELENTQTHLRFDGQHVKFLSPKNLLNSHFQVSALIFPKYAEGQPCRLKPLSSCETLGRIKEAGYQLEKPLTKEHFELILEYLLTKPSYLLSYSSLEEASEIIEALVNG